MIKEYFFFWGVTYVLFNLVYFKKNVECFYFSKTKTAPIFLLRDIADVSKLSEGYDQYVQEKRMKQLKHKVENKSVKQLRITPRIGTNDLQIKINAAKQFLIRRHRVKFTLTLKGREYANIENTKKLFLKISEELKSLGQPEKLRQQGNTVSQLFNLKAKIKTKKEIEK